MNTLQLNIRNIDLAISVMRRVKDEYGDEHFSMYSYQEPKWESIPQDLPDNKLYVTIEDREHIEKCGTVCCLSGWLHIAPEFRNYPNKINSLTSTSGTTKYKFFALSGSNGEPLGPFESIAELFGISFSLAKSIIHPAISYVSVDTELKRKTVSVYGKYATENSNRSFLDINLDIIIDVLERLKAGEFARIS